MVKEVFCLDGVTGKVKGDFTLRTCVKASDRSVVPTANLMITEIADSNGGYEVAHPDYSEDLILFLALTSDTTKYAAIRLSAATGVVPNTVIPDNATIAAAKASADAAARPVDVTAARDAILVPLQDAAFGLARLDAEIDALPAAVQAAIPAAVIPVLTGAIQDLSPATQRLICTQGENRSIPYDLKVQYPGRIPYFAARKKIDDATYLIEPRLTRKSDDQRGFVDLTAADLAQVGEMVGEIELRVAADATNVLKPIQFLLKVKKAVIR